jgi:hypothetical protein
MPCLADVRITPTIKENEGPWTHCFVQVHIVLDCKMNSHTLTVLVESNRQKHAWRNRTLLIYVLVLLEIMHPKTVSVNVYS